MEERQSLSDRAFGGLLWQFAGTGTRGLLQVGFLAILARLVTPEDFGIVGAALIVIGLSAILSELGVGPAVVQRPELRAEHVRAAFGISVATSVVIALAVWLTAPWVAGFFRMPELEAVLVALSAVFVLRGLGVTAESLLQRELSFRALASVDVLSYGVGYGVVGSIFGFLGFGYWALVAGHVGQSLLQTAAYWIVRPHEVAPGFGLGAAKELLVYGGGHTLGRGFNYGARQGDNLVVGRWLSAEALGIYGRVYALLVTPANLFGAVIDRVLFPSLSEIQQDMERRTAAYRRGVAAVAILALPASALVFVLAPEIVAVLLGPQWGEVVLPLQVLSVGLLFRTSYKISDTLARATGVVYDRAVRQAVYAAAVFGGALAGVPWGVPGVAAGILVAITVNFALMAHLSLSHTALSWLGFARIHRPGLLLALAAGAACAAVAPLLRALALPDAVVLAAGVLVPVAVGRALWNAWPGVFLARDGIWAVRLARKHVPRAVWRILFTERVVAGEVGAS